MKKIIFLIFGLILTFSAVPLEELQAKTTKLNEEVKQVSQESSHKSKSYFGDLFSGIKQAFEKLLPEKVAEMALVSKCNDGVWNGGEMGVDCGPVCDKDCCRNGYFDKNLGECDIDRGAKCNRSCEWEKTNGPHGGKFLRVAIDPIDSNIIYTAAYPISNPEPTTDGGVFKSDNGGKTWTEKSKGIDNKELWAIEINPNNRNVLYVGSQDGDIYKTEDAGENWRKVREKSEEVFDSKDYNFDTIYSLEVDPENSDVVMAGGRYGNIYRTKNGGGSWDTVDEAWGLDTDGVISSIQYSPHDSNIIFATSGFMDVWDLDSRHGVFKSVDKGKTWEPATNGLEGNVNFGDTAFDPENPNIVYAVNGLIGTEGGNIFKSTDLGASWEKIHSGGSLSSIEIHPNFPNVIYAGGEGMTIWKSTNGGQDWQNINGENVIITSKDQNNVKSNDVIINAGESPDSGEEFTEESTIDNEYSTENGEIENSAQTGENFTGGVMSSDNGGSFVTHLTFDPVDPNKIYVASYAAGNYKSIDGGDTWEEISDDLDFSYTKALAPYYDRKPGIYASSFTNGIHRTSEINRIDGRLNWKRILNNGLGINGVRTLVTTKMDPDLIYGIGDLVIGSGVTSLEDFRVSYDRGVNWEIIRLPAVSRRKVKLSRDPTRLPVMVKRKNRLGKDEMTNVFSRGEIEIETTEPRVFSVAIDPTNADIAYAATIDAGIFKTVDKGKNWSQINNGLGSHKDFRTIAVAVVPAGERGIQRVLAGAVGEDPEIYYSDNGGENWHKLNDDLTFTTIWGHSQLQIDPDDKETVYAGTWGGGIYKTGDGGHNWEGLTETNDLDGPFSPTCLAVYPGREQSILYACDRTDPIVWRSKNGGHSWHKFHVFDEKDYLLTSAITIDPQNSSKIYVSAFKKPLAHSGGLFVIEDDEGIDNIGSGLPRSAIDIEIDPNSHQTIYVTLHIHGVYKSTDGGQSWMRLDDKNGLPRIGFYDIDVDSDNSNIVYATGLCGELPDYMIPPTKRGPADLKSFQNLDPDAKCGVYKSTDGGEHWNLVLETVSEARGIEIHPQNHNALFVADMMGGVWVSTDGGRNWRQENTGLGSISMTSVKVKDDCVYASTQGSGVYAGKLAHDYSIIWDKEKSNKPKARVFNMQIATDPINPQIVYASGFPGGLLRSDDGGHNWNDKNFLTPTPRIEDLSKNAYYAYAINPVWPENIVLCLFGKGCYISYDRMDFEMPFNAGLENKQVYSVTFDSSGEYVYAGVNGGSVFRAKVGAEKK